MTIKTGKVIRKTTIGILFLLAFVAHDAWSAPKEWPKSMSFPSGRVGTSVYSVVIGMSDLITKYTGVKTVPEGGSTTKNLILLHKKNAELGLGYNDTAYFAARGQGEFKEYGKINVRLLFSNGVPTPFAFITRRDANIKSVSDLKGKNVMCIYPPSITFTTGANMLFETEGMTQADVKAMSFSGNQEGSTALKEKRVAAYIHVQTVNSVMPFLQELNNEVPIRLVSAPEEKLDAILPKYPYFKKAILPEKAYGELTDKKDMVGVGSVDVMLSRGDLPDDLVYEVMKAIFNHVEELLPVHPIAKLWISDPLSTTVLPYHAGAVRYYKEKGLWTDKMESKQKELLAEIGQSK